MSGTADLLTPETVTSWRRHRSHISANDGWLYCVLDVHRARWWCRHAGIVSVPLSDELYAASFVEGGRRRILIRALTPYGFTPVTHRVVKDLPDGITVTSVHRLLGPTFTYALLGGTVTPISATNL